MTVNTSECRSEHTIDTQGIRFRTHDLHLNVLRSRQRRKFLDEASGTFKGRAYGQVSSSARNDATNVNCRNIPITLIYRESKAFSWRALV